MSRKAISILFFITALCLALAPAPAFAQKACVVLSSTAQPFRDAVKGFRSAYSGPVDEIVMPGEPAKAGEIIGDLEARNCAVIVPVGSAALKFLRLRLPDKPMVFAMTLSPAAAGSEGQNITGVYLEPSAEAQLAAVRKVLPAARRIGVLYSAAGEQIHDLQRAAPRLGMEIVAVSTPRVADAVREAASIVNRCDALLMIPDMVTSSNDVFKAMLDSSLRSNVPIFGLAEKHVEAGAIATLSADYAGNGAQAAAMARSIASGSRPSSLAPEHSNKAYLVLNLKAAGRMGIKIPPAALGEAAEVFR